MRLVVRLTKSCAKILGIKYQSFFPGNISADFYYRLLVLVGAG
jgi:hypothetical protein